MRIENVRQKRYEATSPHLDGRQRLFAVALLDANVHIVLAGVVSLRSIREGVCEGAARVSIEQARVRIGLGIRHVGE